MENEEINKIFVLPRKIEFLFRLSLMKDKVVSVADFEKFLGFKNPQPDVRLVFKILFDEDILTYHSTMNNVVLYEINFKKLRDYIDDLTFMEELIHLFYKEHHWVSY